MGPIARCRLLGQMSASNSVLAALDAVPAGNATARPLGAITGARTFRRAMQAIESRGDGALARALADVSPDDLLQRRDWEMALRLALKVLKKNADLEVLLNAWSHRIGAAIRFDEVVAYQLPRRLPSDNAARRQWVAALVPIAIVRRDVPLIETLLLVLRARAAEFPALLDVALACAAESAPLRRALRSSCDM